MDFAADLLEQNRQLAGILTGSDLSTPVPTCPGWTLLQLLRHVGRGDRWAAQIMRDGDGRLDPRDVIDGRPPDGEEAALDWLRSGAALVVDAVTGVGPQTSVPTFLGPRPAQWWLRRRLHEASVHRADVAIARRMPYDLPAGLAVDGIDEWLERLVTEQSQGRPPSLRPGESLTFRATDPAFPEAVWRADGTAAGIAVAKGAGPAGTTLAGTAGTTLAGTAVDLFLAMVRRAPLADTDVRLDGDPQLWETWLATTPL